MARYGSADVGFLLLDGMDVLGATTSVDVGQEAVLEETTVLGVADETHGPVGLKRGTLKQSGFFDDVANGANAALVGLAQRVACLGIAGNIDGRKFVGWAGVILAKYARKPTRAELHKAEAEAQITGVVEDGVVIHILATESADPFTGTPYDNAASSANGGAGYLQVNALTLGGFTNIIFKVRHSVDNVTYADLIVFATVTTSPLAERKAVAGTVNRYVRTEYDFTGAGAGQSARFMMGFVRT